MEDFAREQPETSPVSDYGDEAKLSERRNNERSKDRSYQDANATNSVESGSFAVETHAPFSGGPDGLPSLAQLPPPPPLPHHSQGFSSSSVPPQQSYMGYLPSQSGFNLPPPPPPPLMNQSENLSMPQPSYGNSGAPQPALPPQVSSGIANLPMRPAVSTGPSQVGGQSMAPTSRSSYTWQSTPTAAPASIAYNGQSIQVEYRCIPSNRRVRNLYIILYCLPLSIYLQYQYTLLAHIVWHMSRNDFVTLELVLNVPGVRSTVELWTSTPSSPSFSGIHKYFISVPVATTISSSSTWRTI